MLILGKKFGNTNSRVLGSNPIHVKRWILGQGLDLDIEERARLGFDSCYPYLESLGVTLNSKELPNIGIEYRPLAFAMSLTYNPTGQPFAFFQLEKYDFDTYKGVF